MPHQGFAKSWCWEEQVREACGAFAERVRWEEGSGWQLCVRDTQELGQAAGKLSGTAVPKSRHAAFKSVLMATRVLPLQQINKISKLGAKQMLKGGFVASCFPLECRN